MPEPTAEQVAALEHLEAMFAKIPDVACKGLCGPRHCTTIVFSPAELTRLAEPYPARTEENANDPCPLLAQDGRCREYANRPIVCRVWGATESIRCEHGCEPAGADFLSDADSYAMVLEAALVGGVMPAKPIEDRDAFMVRVRSAVENPLLADVLSRVLQGQGDRLDEWLMHQVSAAVGAGEDAARVAVRTARWVDKAARVRRRRGGPAPQFAQQLMDQLGGIDFETIDDAQEALSRAVESMVVPPGRPRPPAPLKGARTKGGTKARRAAAARRRQSGS